MLSGSRRLLLWLPSCILVGYVAATDLDGTALIQKEHATRRQAAAARPAVVHHSTGNSTGVSAKTALRFGLNSSMLSTTLFRRSKDPTNTFIQFVQVLVAATPKETFMKAFNDMAKQTTQATVSFRDKSRMLREDFDVVLSPKLTEDQFVRLAAEYMEKQARLTANYDDRRSTINKRSIRSMPLEVPDSFMTILTTMSSQDTVTATRTMNVNTEGSMHAYCSEVAKAMRNISKAAKGMVKSKELINGTQSIRPLISSYLSTVKPELVPRIVWVLNQYLDMEYTGADAVETTMKSMSKSLSPVLYERLTCRKPRSASAPRSGLSLLTALALAVLPLLLGDTCAPLR